MMDCFTKWPEAFTAPNHKTSMVAKVLATNFFCCLGVPWEL
jgi:hypothetical protein